MKTRPLIQLLKARTWCFCLMPLVLLALMMGMPTKAWAAENNDETVIIDGVSYHVLRTMGLSGMLVATLLLCTLPM